jgi:hypothetical protein
VAGEEVVRERRPVRATVLDMVRSLGLLAVIVALTLVFVPGLLHPSHAQRYPAASYVDEVTGFHDVTGRAAWVPADLPSGWRANGASLPYREHTAHLHIGWVTPTAQYAGLEESNQPAQSFVSVVLGARGRVVTGSVDIAGASWSRRTSSRGEQSLVRTVGGVTIVITGSATTLQEQQLAAALRPAAR